MPDWGSQTRGSELQDGCSGQVGRRHAFWVVQVAGMFQGCPGPCTYCSARVVSDEIDAQTGDNGTGVVFVQAVEGEAVVEQRRGFSEYLSNHLEVDIGPCLNYCLGSRHERLESWALRAQRHTREALSAPVSRQPDKTQSVRLSANSVHLSGEL